MITLIVQVGNRRIRFWMNHWAMLLIGALIVAGVVML